MVDIIIPNNLSNHTSPKFLFPSPSSAALAMWECCHLVSFSNVILQIMRTLVGMKWWLLQAMVYAWLQPSSACDHRKLVAMNAFIFFPKPSPCKTYVKKKWEKKEAFFFVVFILTGNVTPNLSGRGDWHRIRCLWHVFSGFSILLNTRNDTASLNDVNEMNCIQMQGRTWGVIGGEVVTCFAVKNLWQRKPQEKVKKKKT